MTAVANTVFKKSELNSRQLPPAMLHAVSDGTVVKLAAAPKSVDGEYWLVALPGRSDRVKTDDRLVQPGE